MFTLRSHVPRTAHYDGELLIEEQAESPGSQQWFDLVDLSLQDKIFRGTRGKNGG